jgi:hypothetical protein
MTENAYAQNILYFLQASYINFGMQINLDISAHHTDFLCLVVGCIYCEYEQGNNGKSNITDYKEETYSYYSGSITYTWGLKENKIFFHTNHSTCYMQKKKLHCKVRQHL